MLMLPGVVSLQWLETLTVLDSSFLESLHQDSVATWEGSLKIHQAEIVF